MTNGKESSSSARNHPSPRGLLRAVFASSLGVLFLLVLSRLRTPADQHVDPNPTRKTDDQEENRQEERRRVVTIESNLPATPTDKDKSYRNREEFRNWGILIVELVGLFGLLFYAFTTLGMWKEMQEQTLIQRAARRPWVGIFGQVSLTNPPDYRVFVPGQVTLRLEGTYAVKNFGSSPAFYANHWVNIEFLVSDSVITRPPESRMMCADGPTKLHQGEIIFPGSGVNFGFDQQMGRVIPGKKITEVDRVWLTGCISYLDEGEKLHHTRFWLRSAHPDNAQWISLANADFRYMPITGFESWGEVTD